MEVVRAPKVLSARTLTGDKVTNVNGEDLGRVEEIMIDLEQARIAYVVLSFGSHIRSSKDKLFAVPWEVLSISHHDKKFILNVSEETLKEAPGFDKDDWPDNAERFTLFARAIVALATGKATPEWRADVVHCNDWQTGLVPPLLANESQRPATIFTIHNLAYQGLFPRETFEALKLPEELWSMEALEFHDHFSFIKGGLVFAEVVLFALSARGGHANLAVWLTMIMLPYMPMVCTVAILGAMLQVRGRFGPTPLRRRCAQGGALRSAPPRG